MTEIEHLCFFHHNFESFHFEQFESTAVFKNSFTFSVAFQQLIKRLKKKSNLLLYHESFKVVAPNS